MKQIPSFLILILFLSTACSVKEDVDSMIETTESMEKTTSKMSESTDQLKNRTEDLAALGREALSIQLLNDLMADLKEEKQISKKLQLGILYFGAMEFQHWQGDYEDTAESRLEAYEKSLLLFFTDIKDLINDDFPINTPKLIGKNDWMTLSVLSATMSKVHPRQEHVASSVGTEAVSLYDLITTALSLKPSHERGLEVPEYVKVVLENEPVAVYMLQLRHNFYPFIVAGEMSNIEDGLVNKLSKLFFKWSVDLTHTNKAQFEKWSSVLKKSMRTKSFLKSIGVQPEINKTVAKLYANLQYVTDAPGDFSELMTYIGANTQTDDYRDYQFHLEGNNLPCSNAAEEFVVMSNKITGSSLLVGEKTKAEQETQGYHFVPVPGYATVPIKY